MTRFARAKGSKASNEKLAEQATPWSEMKQQLLDKRKEIEFNTKKKQVNAQREANYKAFLEEKEANEFSNTKWAEFPGVSNDLKGKSKKKQKVLAGDVVVEKVNRTVSSDDETFNNIKAKIDKVLDQRKEMDSDGDGPPDEVSAKQVVKQIIITKPKIKKKLKIVDVKQDEKMKPKKRKISLTENGDLKRIPVQKTSKKLTINNESVKRERVIKQNLSERDLKKIEKKKQKRLRQMEKKKRQKLELKKMKEDERASQNSSTTESLVENNDKSQKKVHLNNQDNRESEGNRPQKKITGKLNTKNFNAKGKLRDKEEYVRRKPFKPSKMIINGKEVEVEYVDGFPVKKEDAIRLKKLRREMISKGLPRSEINISLKLERRKAEKIFAREKKNVCYNCRKSGHNLSECPEVGTKDLVQSSVTGICFKCGSTEHTHFECKVVRGQEYKFAECFICKEQGHIARQCPDNARGLYPKGGACKICGDVTHLKKDCPKYQAQQQQANNNIDVNILDGGNPDILDNKNVSSVKNIKSRPNKIIKF